MNRAILSIILLLIALPLVSASYTVTIHKHDFSLTPLDNSDYSYLCSCAPRVEQYEVKNFGEFTAKFNAWTDNSREYIKLSEYEFTLEPNETKLLFVYLETPCKDDQTQYTLLVESEFGRKEFVQRDLTVKQCQNIKVYDTSVAPADPCQVMHFPLIVENIGGFTEQYTLSFDKYNQYVDASEYQFDLDAGEQKQLEIYAKLSCDISGDIALPFRIQAKTNNLVERFSVTLPIKKSYFYSLDAPEEANVCAEVTQTVPITVENRMPFANPVTLDFTGPGFAHLKDKYLEMQKNTTQSTEITIKADKTSVGQHTLRIDSTSENGGITKTSTTSLNVRNCYDFTSEVFAFESPTMCGEHNYTLNLRNRGTEQVTLDLAHQGADFLEYNPTVNLQPGENKNIEIKANVPCVDENYTIIFTLQDADHDEVSPITTKIKLEGLSRESAYGIDVLDKNVIWYYDTELVPVIIKNTGIRGGQYQLKLDSDLVGINITGVHLLPGEEKVIYLLPRIGVEEFEAGRYVNTIQVTQVDENIKFGRDIEVKLEHRNPFEKWLNGAVFRQNYVSLGGCGIAGIILLLVIGAGVVVEGLFLKRKFKLSRKKIKDKATLYVFMGVMAAGFIVLIVLMATYPAPDTSAWYEGPLNSSVPLEHVWAENHNYQINLSQYFTDPDNDTLHYTSSQPSDVQVHIQGNIATLKPLHGFSGENRIVFTAYDDQGGKTNSDLMTLRVVKKKPVTWTEHWNVYCTQVNMVLIAIIFLLGALILFTYKRQKDEIHAKQVAARRR
ncbi:MAG: hypothetical protein ABIA93_01410 [Candidatus Woesearchaeota archaeon]